MEVGGFPPYRGEAEAGDVIVNWGYSYGSHVPTGVVVLNPRLILDKNKQLHVLRAAGIPAPKSWDNTEEWRVLGSPEPILRKKIHSASGHGIKLLSSPEEMWIGGNPNQMYLYCNVGGGLMRDCYYQEFIDKDLEYRLMQIGPRIAYMMIKHPVPGKVVWNLAAGSEWEMAHLSGAALEEIRGLGEATLKAIGYHHGAIDLVRKDGKYYIIEVNSRPALGSENVHRVADAFHKYIDNREWE